MSSSRGGRGGQGSSQRGGHGGQGPSIQDHKDRLAQAQRQQKNERKEGRVQANDTSRTMHGKRTKDQMYEDMKDVPPIFKDHPDEPEVYDPGPPDPRMKGTDEYYDQLDEHERAQSQNDTAGNIRVQRFSAREEGHRYPEDFTRDQAVDVWDRSEASATQKEKANALAREQRTLRFPGEDKEPNAE